jgi:hypothetical protein
VASADERVGDPQLVTVKVPFNQGAAADLTVGAVKDLGFELRVDESRTRWYVAATVGIVLALVAVAVIQFAQEPRIG